MDRRNGYQNNEGSGLTMLLAGFIFGVAALALYDDNIRNRLKKNINAMRRDSKEKFEEVKENLEDEVQKGKRKIAKKLSNGQAKIARAM